MRSWPDVGCSSPVIMRNSVVLPAPLGPMMPTMPPAGNRNVRSSISTRVVESFAEIGGLHDQFPQVFAGRNLNFEFVQSFFEALGCQFFVGLDAGLALGLPRRGAIRTHSSSRCSDFCRASEDFSSRPSRSRFCSSQDE